MLRKLAIFKKGKVVHRVAFFLHHFLGAMLRNELYIENMSALRAWPLSSQGKIRVTIL